MSSSKISLHPVRLLIKKFKYSPMFTVVLQRATLFVTFFLQRESPSEMGSYKGKLFLQELTPIETRSTVKMVKLLVVFLATGF